MVVPVILAKVVAAVAAKKHVAGQEVQVVAVFVFGKDLHAVIPVAGEKLPRMPAVRLSSRNLSETDQLMP